MPRDSAAAGDAEAGAVAFELWFVPEDLNSARFPENITSKGQVNSGVDAWTLVCLAR